MSENKLADLSMAFAVEIAPEKASAFVGAFFVHLSKVPKSFFLKYFPFFQLIFIKKMKIAQFFIKNSCILSQNSILYMCIFFLFYKFNPFLL